MILVNKSLKRKFVSFVSKFANRKVSDNIEDTKTFSNKYFSFLVSDFGFNKPIVKTVAYEFHFIYPKGSLEIDIYNESGNSIPWVTLIKNGNNFDIESLEDNETLNTIRQKRIKRYNPKFDRFLNDFKPGNFNESYSELEHDYVTSGRDEVEVILKETAEIIKRHKQILGGNLWVFRKRKLFRVIQKFNLFGGNRDASENI